MCRYMASASARGRESVRAVLPRLPTSPFQVRKTNPPDAAVPKTSGSTGTTRRCYNCGLSGHIARACPYPKPSWRDGEATGRPVLGVSVERRTDERRQRIEELRRELRDTELAEDVDKAIPAAHIVSPTPGSRESTLGPSVIVQLGVNGVLTDALVDTGSPATIVSLKFILQVLADSKDGQQTAEEWRKKTMERFSAPAVTLTSCGGERLNIVAQIPVVLSQGEQSVDAVVLVQKDARHSLLLVTDLQARLGFSLFSETNGRKVDLLRADKDGPDHMDQVEMPSALSEQTIPISTTMAVDQSGQGYEEDLKSLDKKNSSSRVGVVRLLQNVRVPPGYKKIIRARMEGELQHGLLLCTPCTDQPVVMADSILEGGEGCCVNFIVENHSVEPARLKKGTILGEVAEVEEVVSDQTPVAQLHTTGATLLTTQERTGGEVLVGTEDTTPNVDSVAVHGVVSELCEDQGTSVVSPEPTRYTSDIHLATAAASSAPAPL